MSSFERLVLQEDQRPARRIRALLEPSDLLQLRATSINFQRWIEADEAFFRSAFQILYIRNTSAKSPAALEHIAGNCHHLVIKLRGVHRPVDTATWRQTLDRLPTIVTLTISTRGPSTWAPTAPLSATLVSLRACLENSNLPHLTALRLAPFHATGILDLRWSGAALGDASWTSRPFWEHLTALEVQLVNPLPALSPSNRLDFLKAVNDWLGSFRFALRRFKWHWISARGPNPLLLDMKYGRKKFGAPAVRWAALDEVWVGNVEVGREAVGWMCERAERLVDCHVLRDEEGISTNRGDRQTVSFKPGRAWQVVEASWEDLARRERRKRESEESITLPESFGFGSDVRPSLDGEPIMEIEEAGDEDLSREQDARRQTNMTSFTMFIMKDF